MTELFSPERPRLFEMKGRDARDFLHRLTTVNTRFMTPHQGAPGFFLTAQGKVRAYFHLWCLADDHFLFELDGGGTPETSEQWAQALLRAIDEMTFGEKFTVTPVEGLENAWLLFAPGQAGPGQAETVIQSGDSLFVLHHGDRDFGRDWISVWGTADQVAAFAAAHGAKPADPAKLDLYRIESVTPAPGSELVFDVNPLEIGLKRGIADNKGCYPGQEVIEKIISLGAPARRLALVRGEGAAPARGEKIQTAEGADAGEITSVAANASGFSALAILRKNAAKENASLKFLSTPSTATVIELAPYDEN